MVRIKNLYRKTYLDKRQFRKLDFEPEISILYTYKGSIIRSKVRKASIYEHRMTHDLWAFDTDAFYRVEMREGDYIVTIPT